MHAINKEPIQQTTIKAKEKIQVHTRFLKSVFK